MNLIRIPSALYHSENAPTYEGLVDGIPPDSNGVQITLPDCLATPTNSTRRLSSPAALLNLYSSFILSEHPRAKIVFVAKQALFFVANETKVFSHLSALLVA